MEYLQSFLLPGEKQETEYVIGDDYRTTMACYPKDLYPFKIFPQKGLGRIDFEPITIFYGGNGSGKSTLLTYG